MAGPTPVSALIHAATMVTSGVYLICRLSDVFAVAPATMAVVAVTGTLTALLAATIALVQNNMKRILAYSTVSQLGFMFAAVGCGAFAAGIFHVYTHAFFKACLFLGAGSVMHAVGAHGDADIRELGGLHKYQPRTHWTFALSCAAIAGVPFFSGFFSKDEILVGALSAGGYFAFAPWLGYALFGLLVVAAVMTAFYMFRLFFVTFWNGEYRGGPSHGDEHGHHEPHESPDSMTWPLIILGAGAFGAGYFWVGIFHFEPWVTWLEPSLGSIGTEHSGAIVAALCGIAAAVVGIYLAWAWYYKPGVEIPRQLAEGAPGVHAFLMDKWRVDEFYDATVLRASRGLGLLSAHFDKNAVDGLLAWVTSQGVRLLSFLFTRIQTGLVHSYGAFMMAGMVVVGWWFLFPHPHVGVHESVEEIAYNPVRLEAGPGLGYQYRWDFNSDGEFETEWEEQLSQSHSFGDDEFEPGAVVVVDGFGYGVTRKQYRLEPGEALPVCPTLLGDWRRDDPAFIESHPHLVGAPPHVAAGERGVVVRPNGARVRVGGARAEEPDEEIQVGPGVELFLGDARLTVVGSVRVTVAVKNAVGFEATDSVRITLQRESQPGAPQARVGGAR
jgi:NADH-quinone oxidoreductase subunit L